MERGEEEDRGGGMAQTVYAHVSKGKDDKKKRFLSTHYPF
jgi:hypothetical protein